MFRGHVIYQRKKNIANEIRLSVFASVPQSGFFSGSLENQCSLETESLPLGFLDIAQQMSPSVRRVIIVRALCSLKEGR